jgi:hypothetical protein
MPVLPRIRRSFRELTLGGLQIGDVDDGLIDHGSRSDPTPVQQPRRPERPLSRRAMLCHAPEQVALDTKDFGISHVDQPCGGFCNGR